MRIFAAALEATDFQVCSYRGANGLGYSWTGGQLLQFGSFQPLSSPNSQQGQPRHLTRQPSKLRPANSTVPTTSPCRAHHLFTKQIRTSRHGLLFDTADGQANTRSDGMFCAAGFRDGPSFPFNASADASDAKNPDSTREAEFTERGLRRKSQHRSRAHPWAPSPWRRPAPSTARPGLRLLSPWFQPPASVTQPTGQPRRVKTRILCPWMARPGSICRARPQHSEAAQRKRVLSGHTRGLPMENKHQISSNLAHELSSRQTKHRDSLFVAPVQQRDFLPGSEQDPPQHSSPFSIAWQSRG